MNRTVRRRLVTLASAALVWGVTSVSLATPAGADVPEGWPEADNGSTLHNLMLIAGVPLLLALLIALAIYVPALVRGERITPGATSPENEWLGGPRRSSAELAGPDTDHSEAGGASGRW